MRISVILIGFLLWSQVVFAKTIRVGRGQQVTTLSAASQSAEAGDTILWTSGTYSGGQSASGLSGTQENPVIILAEVSGSVIFDGGGEAWHLSNLKHVIIRGFVFKNNSSNGVNCDDGGSLEGTAHHITFEHCTFRDINSSGNSDLLKMSGVDDFTVRRCTFINGSTGAHGSGLDMVGCHNGIIENNAFESMGGGAIQAKGGTQYITIQKNFFKNCGTRSLNLGGSTGLDYFRPPDAGFEASDLFVYSNVFIGSEAPIAYVTSVNVHVVNNTIIHPGKWVVRILQEQSDLSRFVSCGEGVFRNNLVVINDNVSVLCNVGNNTRPETFTFSNNLWYHSENPDWSGLDLPVTDADAIVGQDPLLTDFDGEVFTLKAGSPAAAAGFAAVNPVEDFTGALFAASRAIGAFEAGSSPVVRSCRSIFPAGIMEFRFIRGAAVLVSGGEGRMYLLDGRMR